ncbi:putative peroxisomal-coenzyme A synthetase [Hypsizygus marmoreus]|uniref:Peroxisomal-coenzyme A synthetase n=1 Tax=Hypsizygus marmoreus TaxID=39966 RepID=A0A369JBA7_HYPMA|nr:putative peroxisomal-coenzyme A synthetase [Hypsizygus marmoreus]
MAIPLSFLRSSIAPGPAGAHLGELLTKNIRGSGVETLLDCLCTTAEPAIHSPDPSRPPLRHDELHSFVSHFSLPHSPGKQLGPNDRVMLVLETGPENALALTALASYHTCAPVNANCTAAELMDDARRLNVKAVLTTKDTECRLKLAELRDELGCEIIYAGRRTTGPAGLFDMKLMEEGPVVSTSPPSKLHRLSDRSLVLHTSGTSGKKKVVPYSLLSLIVGTWSVVDSWGLQTTDVNFNMMPLFHVGGIVRNLLAPILSGGSTIMCSQCDPIAFWSLASELHATWYYAAPTIHHAIISAKPNDEKVLQNIRIRMICNAAGGLLPSLAVEIKNTFNGAVILPSYGMTECMPIASPPQDYQLDRPGCSGIACGPQLSIRNPSNIEEELPIGKTGAVSVRGLPTFEGYEVSPDVDVPLDTSAFSSEGWFDSGDVGFMDADGYLYITGRSKEIINKGGEVISPFEIEEAIMNAAKDHVKSTLAFGIDHDVLQETIGVVIVPVPDRPRIGLLQLQTLLKDYLHPSKWPFAVVYMDELPKNSAGKVLRIKLASRLGIEQLTDHVPMLARHFEAEVPSNMVSLSVPIPCSRVTVDLSAIERNIEAIHGIQEFAARLNDAGLPEAFISVHGTSELDADTVRATISASLPGYCIPELHILDHPLIRNQGQVDFGLLEEEVSNENASPLSDTERLVRNIVADLVVAEHRKINRNSDFFLLGGNSLLLGKLSYNLRKETGASVGIAALFRRSTIAGIVSLVEEATPPLSPPNNPLASQSFFDLDEKLQDSPLSSETTLAHDYDPDIDLEDFEQTFSRDQTNPLNLIVQALPLMLFYPLKSAFTWTLLLFLLSYLARAVDHSYWQRVVALILAICAARGCSRIICPLAAIAFKWVVIGKYRIGTHRMWSTYYLRWWIVNQSLRSAGRGVFAMHPVLEILYYRMLGARIGRNVHIDKSAKLGEYDLLTFEDGCRIDNSQIRGFCVERDGQFRLDPITIGRRAVVNTFTVISPGTVIADGAVFGPHASSYDQPVPRRYAAYNRTMISQPRWWLQALVAWPIIAFVYFVSYMPWFAMIWLMLDQTILAHDNLNAMESVIYWFASPNRVLFHALSRVVRATLTPLLHLVLGIMVKRAFGLNTECSAADSSQLSILRRYINSVLLSQQALKQAFLILGSHYETVSMVFRAMGAKVGKRVYWPGSGFYCLDPEMLEIGDDVVFGSRSEIFTTDRLGTSKICVGDGAMIADRVVLLPGARIGKRTVMGSGSLCKRNTTYPDGSTWMGSENGEAICLSTSPTAAHQNASTISPFGRAFYLREANYFVFPYFLIVLINFVVASLSATFWSISAVAAAQVLRHIHIHLRHLHLFRPHWYRLGLLYGLIAACFVMVLTLQAVISMAWVILTKWVIIGRRREGRYDWDQSSYCQRWQLHLTLSRLVYKGYGIGGVLAPLTGSVYIVWYLRALGAKIGKNCAIYAGGRTGLMTEPDLVELGDDVNLDECSVVAHINSRGRFALNKLQIGNGCAMRAGSRLLSGASMEDSSMLCEHSLLTSGEIAESGAVYAGWPAKRIPESSCNTKETIRTPSGSATLICPICRQFPKGTTVTVCGHLFCERCITDAALKRRKCPVCMEPSSAQSLRKIYASFAVV